MPADDLRDFADRLRGLSNAEIAADMAGALADVWVDRAKQVMGYDTGQLYERTQVEGVTASGSSAEALVVADTPYAGWHSYGTRFTPPNRFWDEGFDAAQQAAEGQVGARVVQSIERVLTSGGVWNPVRRR